MNLRDSTHASTSLMRTWRAPPIRYATSSPSATARRSVYRARPLAAAARLSVARWNSGISRSFTFAAVLGTVSQSTHAGFLWHARGHARPPEGRSERFSDSLQALRYVRPSVESFRVLRDHFPPGVDTLCLIGPWGEAPEPWQPSSQRPPWPDPPPGLLVADSCPTATNQISHPGPQGNTRCPISGLVPGGLAGSESPIVTERHRGGRGSGFGQSEPWVVAALSAGLEIQESCRLTILRATETVSARRLGDMGANFKRDCIGG